MPKRHALIPTSCRKGRSNLEISFLDPALMAHKFSYRPAYDGGHDEEEEGYRQPELPLFHAALNYARVIRFYYAHKAASAHAGGNP